MNKLTGTNLFTLVFLSITALANQPNPQLTPGFLCTPQDPNFKGLAYAENVAICNRNIGYGEKVQVSQSYNVPQANWRNVEFDHLIPLCAGGSNDIRNLWPEALDHAHLKDRVEDQICTAMKNGTMTQAQAITTVFDWLKQHP